MTYFSRHAIQFFSADILNLTPAGFNLHRALDTVDINITFVFGNIFDFPYFIFAYSAFSIFGNGYLPGIFFPI